MMAAASATVYSSKPLWYMEPVANAPRNTTNATNMEQCRTDCGEEIKSGNKCTHFQFKKVGADSTGTCAWYSEPLLSHFRYNENLGEMTSVHAIDR